MKIRLRGREARCPLCRVRHFPGDGEETYDCSGCEVRYHRDCADELGGCSTLGCPRLGLKPDEETPEQETAGTRIRRGLRASRQRRQDRPRLAQEHRAERVQAGQRPSFWSDFGLDFGADAGCCCLLGVLELAAATVLVGLLLFPPGLRVAQAPVPEQRLEAPPPAKAVAPAPEQRPS